MKWLAIIFIAIMALCTTANAEPEVDIYGVNVAVYGVIDEGIVDTSNVKTGGSNTAKSPNVGGNKLWLDSVDGLSGSRLGLYGSGKLTDDYSLSFRLEDGINLNNGASQQGGLLYGRQVWFGVTNKDYGTLRVGRQYSSMFDYIGPLALSDQIGSAFAALPGDLDSVTVGQRVNNAIKYLTPSIHGFTAEALYGLGALAGHLSQNSIYSFGANYINGPVTLAVGELHINQPNTSYYSNSAIGAFTLGTATSSVTTTSNPAYGGYVSANSVQIAAAGGTYSIGTTKFGLIVTNVNFDNLQSPLAGSGLMPSATGAQGNAVFNAAELNGMWRYTPVWQGGLAYSYTRGNSVRFGHELSNGTFDTGGARYSQVTSSTVYTINKHADLSLVDIYQIASGVDSTGTKAVAGINLAGASTNGHQNIIRFAIRIKFGPTGRD